MFLLHSVELRGNALPPSSASCLEGCQPSPVLVFLSADLLRKPNSWFARLWASLLEQALLLLFLIYLFIEDEAKRSVEVKQMHDNKSNSGQ